MIRVKDITIIAILAAILFIQEQALMGLPNVQLTVLILIVYTKAIGVKKTILIVLIHTILDNLLWGFDIRYFIPMLLGWLFIPFSLGTIFKKVEKPLTLAILGILYAFIYSWLMAFPQLLIDKSVFITYLIGDIPFEIIFAASSFATILWLYEPLKKVITNLETQYFGQK